MEQPLHIVLIEPFLGGSHQTWAEGLKQHSKHHIEILGLPDRHWKWRMHGAAITLAGQYRERQLEPDLIIATDMLDLSTFLGLTRDLTANIPVIAYFHENQLSYPWSENDADVELKRDRHYAFINYTSALAADAVWFNSNYHKEAFLEALPGYLKVLPDYKGLDNVPKIASKSRVVHLGMNLRRFDAMEVQKQLDPPLILWNHRWEYDKDPETFFNILITLAREGHAFELAVLGKDYTNAPPIFQEAKEKLSDRIVQWGHSESEQAYIQWLKKAAVLPVTSRQDFFGLSTVEAIYAGAYPLLPKRLAFPDHIAPKDYPECYWETSEELLTKLRSLLNDPSRLDKNTYSSLVSGYDWSVMIELYDDGFSRLVAG